MGKLKLNRFRLRVKSLRKVKIETFLWKKCNQLRMLLLRLAAKLEPHKEVSV